MTVKVLGQDGHFQMNGLCNQIGEGGIAGIISAELPISELVDLQFSIPPESRPSTLRAIVRWRDRLQHGFEFFGISSELSAKIKTFCEVLSKRGYVIR